MVDLTFTGTYPDDADWWMSPDDGAPWRYGDLVRTPATAADDGAIDSKGRPWRALLLTHPSCELSAKGTPAGVQAVRVFRLREVSQRQGAEIVTGYVEVGGALRVARVHQVYVAPVPGDTTLSERLFADLRQTVRIPFDVLHAAGRAAAMSHEARVAVLRRDIYFRYRWPLSLHAVAELEARRIGADSEFVGPRPAWAPSSPAS